jgi:hypothetical protein
VECLISEREKLKRKEIFGKIEKCKGRDGVEY